jgi:hypothetical protein
VEIVLQHNEGGGWKAIYEIKQRQLGLSTNPED